jgi:hypothetical protein
MVKITKAIASTWLSDVPQGKQFWCTDSREFKNLADLAAGFKAMSDQTFRYHSNETRNDFSKWVKDVIGDEKLAEELRKAKNPAQAAKVVAVRISALKTL